VERPQPFFAQRTGEGVSRETRNTKRERERERERETEKERKIGGEHREKERAMRKAGGQIKREYEEKWRLRRWRKAETACL